MQKQMMPRANEVSFERLAALLGARGSPEASDKIFIHLEGQVAFEPFGVASESWEVVWVLTLPQVRAGWKSTAGWKQCLGGMMSFSGRTTKEVLAKAIAFVSEVNLEDFRIEEG
jgi:hypothetical protein